MERQERGLHGGAIACMYQVGGGTCHGGGMDERISHGTVSSATDLGMHSPRSPSMPAGSKPGGRGVGQAHTSMCRGGNETGAVSVDTLSIHAPVRSAPVQL